MRVKGVRKKVCSRILLHRIHCCTIVLNLKNLQFLKCFLKIDSWMFMFTVMLQPIPLQVHLCASLRKYYMRETQIFKSEKKTLTGKVLPWSCNLELTKSMSKMHLKVINSTIYIPDYSGISLWRWWGSCILNVKLLTRRTMFTYQCQHILHFVLLWLSSVSY